ncbi:MAG: aminomethyl transferase family protein [Planctomycetes bacterium]|nr:aminomethyl transferase family protein [Planctomycetota bacterium]
MDRPPLLDFHRTRGTRLAERPEAPGYEAALAFGDVPTEYHAARRGCALLDTSDRGQVTLRGPDAADFLHRLLANHVKSLGPGNGNANLLLSPKGKVLFDFDLVRHAEHFELSTPPGRAPSLRAALERYHFSERIELTDTSAGHAPVELEGPTDVEILARLLGAQRPELAPHAWRALPWKGGSLELHALAARRWRLDAGPARAGELWEALCTAGATPCGLVVRDSLRVEAGRALSGVDVDENVYPQEAGLELAFALDKGCYVGQEVVAKIDTYGGLNKRLLVLRVDHSDPVARRTRLLREDEGERRELGLVTSWAYSFALDGGLVLAYVKRRHQEPGTSFELGDEHGNARGRATIVAPPGASTTRDSSVG